MNSDRGPDPKVGGTMLLGDLQAGGRCTCIYRYANDSFDFCFDGVGENLRDLRTKRFLREVGMRIDPAHVLINYKEDAGQVIENRSGEAEGVDPIQNTGVSENQRTVVVDSPVAFDGAHRHRSREA